jgi:cytoskeleton protein RodZ
MSAGGVPNPAASGAEPTAGALLREAREAQGVHLASLAASLKVPVEKLEALEQDRFDLLLDAAFARALASGMCRLLKLDPQPILQRLPPLNPTRVTSQNRGINEPFRPRGVPGTSLPTQISKPVILVGLALLLGAAALVFLPAIQQKTTDKPAGEPTSSEPISSGTPSTVQETVQNSAPVTSENLAGTVPLPSVLTASAPAVVATPAASAPVLAPGSALVQPVPGVATTGTPSDPIATFSAKGESWVKVTDAKGVVVLQRTLQAGESEAVSGALPLRVVIGRADAMQVQVRGQMLDMKALSPDNVARFEVK